MNESTGWFLVIVVACAVWFVGATCYNFYVADIPRIHNGHVIYVAHFYGKLNNEPYTDVEVLTYSGDTHHIYFWGHPELNLSTNYHIHTVIEPHFHMLPFPHWLQRERITEIEVIER